MVTLASFVQLAEVKYPTRTPEEATGALYAGMQKSGGPKVRATGTSTKGTIYDKLTDSSQYTGAHKHRFDDDGRGRGKAGRDGISKGGTPGGDLSSMTRTNLNTSGTTANPRGPRGATSSPTRSIGTRSPAAASRSLGGSSRGAPSESSPMAAASSLSSAGGAAPASVPPGGDGSGDELHEIFLDYCAFGSGGSGMSDQIDNVKFSKLCRECKVIGKTLSPASVDITFSKVKAKGKRTIAYEEFQQALAMLAAEKYARLDPHDAFDKVIGLILKKGGPSATGTGTSTRGNIFDKLTDSSQYTGAHKHRFDGDGHGRGAAGRDAVAKGGAGKYRGGAVSDLSQITRPNLR